MLEAVILAQALANYRTRWHCRRCDVTFCPPRERCNCTESPSPWEPAPEPDINQAPKMSNRKLRNDLEELKKQVEPLRQELANRQPQIVYLPQPQTEPIQPYYPPVPWYPGAEITCVAPEVGITGRRIFRTRG
jgi:hypothetical protein